MAKIKSYEDLKGISYGVKTKGKERQLPEEIATGIRYTPEQLRAAELRRTYRALQAETIFEVLPDEEYAELCKKHKGLKGARMAIARIQSRTSNMSANNRLCNYLKVEY